MKIINQKHYGKLEVDSDIDVVIIWGDDIQCVHVYKDTLSELVKVLVDISNENAIEKPEIDISGIMDLLKSILDREGRKNVNEFKELLSVIEHECWARQIELDKNYIKENNK